MTKTLVESNAGVADIKAPEQQQDRRAQPQGARGFVVTAPTKKAALVFVALCIMGIAISGELARIHLFVHTDSSYHSICAVSDGLNCETVAESPHSVFLGLPVAVWGLIGYLVMGIFALSAMTERRLHPHWPWGILLVLTTCSVGVSVALAYISTTQIDSLCLFCMASYLVNVALLATCLVIVKRGQLRIARVLTSDVKALLVRPRTTGLVVFVGFSLVGLPEAVIPTYWSTPGWSDLPKLASGVDVDGHHWLGGCNPAITISEFSDYECPHCRAAHKQIRKLAAKHPTEIRLVHRHLPLDAGCNLAVKRPFHTHACLFAEAAECAGLQGRFWEMNDALFSFQQTAKAESVDPIGLAVRLGLNCVEFKRCLEKHATLPRITDDLHEAQAKHLHGTPSFFVGEQLYIGNVPGAELDRLLRSRIAQQASDTASFPTKREFCDGTRATEDAGGAL